MSGVSLNDILHADPKLQMDLLNVLIWFRQFRYVFSVDMEKMYRQINVHSDDWKFQRIRWSASEDSLQSFDLTTVTYGLACAYLALRTISQLIEDEGKEFPLAVPCLRQGRYVDDIFGGAEWVEKVQEIIHQLCQLCMAGGFPLQTWASNNANILNNHPSKWRFYLKSCCPQPGDVATSKVEIYTREGKPRGCRDQRNITFSASNTNHLVERAHLAFSI